VKSKTSQGFALISLRDMGVEEVSSPPACGGQRMKMTPLPLVTAPCEERDGGVPRGPGGPPHQKSAPSPGFSGGESELRRAIESNGPEGNSVTVRFANAKVKDLLAWPVNLIAERSGFAK
jgi:hypothetical protein